MERKKMLTHEQIYKIMKWLPVAVAAVFFIINATKGNTSAMLVIGLCLAVFIALPIVAVKCKLSMYNKELLQAIAMPIVVFLISLFSGASYSDDFCIHLAVIAMTGMFMEPKITLTQILISDVMLVLMYIIHPEKSGGLSQYLLCSACYVLASALFYQVVKRGRIFTEISEARARESEGLLHSIREMGAELQTDFEASSTLIENGTQGLQNGSESITREAEEVAERCSDVQSKIRESQDQLSQLNSEVRKFEEGLVVNKKNVTSMNEQVSSAGELIAESGMLFREMQQMTNEIVGIAKQISDISFKLTILSLNASVESAHAGAQGSGFEVIAMEMRELSETSGGFANQVADVVDVLRERVKMTSEKFGGSEEALTASRQTMKELVESFDKLNTQFEALYGNIEGQNYIVGEMDSIFEELSNKAEDMHSSSVENQKSVSSIAEAMDEYRVNIDKVVKNTQSI